MKISEFLYACDIDENLAGYPYLVKLVKLRKMQVSKGKNFFNITEATKEICEDKDYRTVLANCTTIINILIDNMSYNSFIKRYFDMNVTLKRFICVAAQVVYNEPLNFNEDKCVMCGRDISDLSSHVCDFCKKI